MVVLEAYLYISMLPKQPDDTKPKQPGQRGPKTGRKKHQIVLQEEPEWVDTVKLFKDFLSDINQCKDGGYNLARLQLVLKSQAWIIAASS